MRMNLNHWFIKNNELSISLMQFYVSILIYKKDNICFILKVNNGNMEDIYLYFDTLEDAVSFTENSIVNSNSFDDILNTYKEHYCGKTR